MEYRVGDRLIWNPVYFKWDKPSEVTVTKTYRRGFAAISNNKIVDEDGFAYWYGKLAGTVQPMGKKPNPAAVA